MSIYKDVELKTGDVVEVLNGNFYMFFDLYGNKQEILVQCTGKEISWMTLTSCKSMEPYYNLSIKTIYRPNSYYSWPFINNKFQRDLYCVIYEINPKKLTKREIEAKLGYPIEIIDE